MKKINLLLVVFVCSANITNAQTSSFLWSKGMGGTGDDKGFSIAVDRKGNVYTTGTFHGTADFDPGPGIYDLVSAGFSDLFISSLDVLGNFRWAKSISATYNHVEGKCVVIDENGNIYITGYFDGVTDFDSGPGIYNLKPAGNGDIFIVKLNSLGNFLWAKNMGGILWDYGRSVAVDRSENIYITGNFNGIADFDPGPGIYNLSAADGTAFVCKLDGSGNFLWAKQMGETSDYGYNTIGYSIAVDASGNVCTTGRFDRTADFDPGPQIYKMNSAGRLDVFVSKLDASGNFIWAKQLGGTEDDEALCITVDDKGNIYTTGYFYRTADFDPGPGIYDLKCPRNNSNAFVSELDASGNFLWAKQLGGANDGSYGRSVAVDINGNVYTTGYYYGTVDFDPGAGIYDLTSAGYTDIYVSGLDVSGNFLWAKRMGGASGHDEGYSIAVDSKDNIYTTGCFYGTVDFDPGTGINNLVSLGHADIFLTSFGSGSSCSPVNISVQPAGQTAVIGTTASLNVIAAGSTPLTYQWKKNGISIDGANSNSYTTPPLILSDNESRYSCSVTNCGGRNSVTSNIATLTVNPSLSVIKVTDQQIPPWQREGDVFEGSITVSTQNPAGASWHLEIDVLDSTGKYQSAIIYPSLASATQKFYSSDPQLKHESFEGNQFVYYGVLDANNTITQASGYTKIIHKKWKNENVVLYNNTGEALKIPLKYIAGATNATIQFRRVPGTSHLIPSINTLTTIQTINQKISNLGYLTIPISNSNNLEDAPPGVFEYSINYYKGVLNILGSSESGNFDLTKIGHLGSISSNDTLVVLLGGNGNFIESDLLFLDSHQIKNGNPDASFSIAENFRFGTVSPINANFNTWYIAQSNTNYIENNAHDIGIGLGKIIQTCQINTINIKHIIVVCHSFGGVQLRAMLGELGRKLDGTSNILLSSYNISPPIEKVIFLGTPHRGVTSGSISPVDGNAANEMKEGSQFLDNIENALLPNDIQFLNITGYDSSNNLTLYEAQPSDGVVPIWSSQNPVLKKEGNKYFHYHELVQLYVSYNGDDLFTRGMHSSIHHTNILNSTYSCEAQSNLDRIFKFIRNGGSSLAKCPDFNGTTPLPNYDIKANLPKRFTGYVTNITANKTSSCIMDLSLNKDGSYLLKGSVDDVNLVGKVALIGQELIKEGKKMYQFTGNIDFGYPGTGYPGGTTAPFSLLVEITEQGMKGSFDMGRFLQSPPQKGAIDLY